MDFLTFAQKQLKHAVQKIKTTMLTIVEHQPEEEDQLPWLILPSHDFRTNSITFLDFSVNEVINLKFPETQGKIICGFSMNWLIMIDDGASEITLFSPITRDQIRLPPIMYKSMKQEFVHKAILSSSPDNSLTDYIVMVIYGESKQLAYYNASIKTWTLLEEAGSYYDDIICFEDGLYAVDEYGKLVIFNPNRCSKITVILNPSLFQGQKLYLVDLEGDLGLVIRYISDEPNIGCGTYKFTVHIQDQGKWVEIKNLDECAALVGYNQSIVLCSERLKGLKSDCIYFTDYYLDEKIKGGSQEICVFSLENCSFQSLR
ncbi:hypothetical protein HS088_TW06G01392 [Tripterygium wilfordii]|uniref:KIB1-4 beta-propeller domain-containing protein n=1 Tax=Tripterygium wilfordii TaxID=458696 RepID=A0A7J7DLJ8_TRIWF|nr:F-box protein SKIP23-like [Tripterygium wilfordii]KAF5747211.1 hypothetical protein HS088_TW06G01392 [Tripterygium wilfordii]